MLCAEFQLMDFTKALKSCSTENKAFIHIEEDRYFQIAPLYPYIDVKEYLLSLPKPLFNNNNGMDTVDRFVAAFVALFLLFSVVAILVKMQLLCWCDQNTTRRYSRAPGIWKMMGRYRPLKDSDVVSDEIELAESEKFLERSSSLIKT